MTFTSDPPTGGWCRHYGDSFQIQDCEDQVNRIDTEDQVIWFVLAAWGEEKEWCGTEFGFGEYDPAVFNFTAHGPCWPQDGLEIPTPGWPGPQEGTAIVVTGTPWEGNFVPVYWFAGYAYEDEPGLIALAADPATDFAGTSNCANPPEAWAADSLGAMGLFQDGVFACPAGLMAGGQSSGPVGGGGIEPEAGGGFLSPEEHNVIFVCPGTPDSTIQVAVALAADGDTIELCCDLSPSPTASLTAATPRDTTSVQAVPGLSAMRTRATARRRSSIRACSPTTGPGRRRLEARSTAMTSAR